MLLHLDFSSDIPIYIQIRNQIVLGIAEGKLSAGEKLPTVRALSEECGINMMTVSKAYQLLKQEGYIQTDRRAGAMVKHPEKQTGPRPETIEGLKLRLSELRLAGMTIEDTLKLCRTLYEEGEA